VIFLDVAFEISTNEYHCKYIWFGNEFVLGLIIRILLTTQSSPIRITTSIASSISGSTNKKHNVHHSSESFGNMNFARDG